jgi:hypothetical protein
LDSGSDCALGNGDGGCGPLDSGSDCALGNGDGGCGPLDSGSDCALGNGDGGCGPLDSGSDCGATLGAGVGHALVGASDLGLALGGVGDCCALLEGPAVRLDFGSGISSFDDGCGCSDGKGASLTDGGRGVVLEDSMESRVAGLGMGVSRGQELTDEFLGVFEGVLSRFGNPSWVV